MGGERHRFDLVTTHVTPELPAFLVENLVAHVYGNRNNNTYLHLARKILSTRLTFATFRDEFHPNPDVLSATAEGLVRQLVVLKAAKEIEQDLLSAFFQLQHNTWSSGGQNRLRKVK